MPAADLNSVHCHDFEDRFSCHTSGFILHVCVTDVCEPVVPVMTFWPHVASKKHILKLRLSGLLKL